jgi:hypothetical protein
MLPDSSLDLDASSGPTRTRPISAAPLKAPQRLPAELWGRVAHYLYDDVPALLALRAVCSDCTAELTPLAFRVVWFHDTPASVQRLKGLRAGGVVAHLFRHVRQARVLVKGAPPSAPPKRRSRLGHSFARLLNRREEPAPLAARDASAQTFKGECTVQCRSGQGMF